MNPIFPLDVTIADPEVHLFAGRLWLYGSHDVTDGKRYCPGDYEAFSCDVNLTEEWQSEGIIYRKRQDPANQDGSHDLYAPDVVCHKGVYYLYYALSGIDAISVASASSPRGPFQYLGKVQYPEGVDLDALPELPSCFDPAVLEDDGHIRLSFGFSYAGTIPDMDLSERRIGGGYTVELAEDMLTMKTLPRCVIPGVHRADGTSFSDHPFLEAASLRKFGDDYYYVYSSQAQHELCYARSKKPEEGFVYAGILISNAGKIHPGDSYLSNYANNHGCLVQIKDQYAVFYHRHTCGTQYSRQVCAEWIVRKANGMFESTVPTAAGLAPAIKQGVSLPAACASALVDLPTGVFIPFEGLTNHSYIHKDIIRGITDTAVRWNGFAGKLKEVQLLMDGDSAGTIALQSSGAVIASQHVQVRGRTEVQFSFEAAAIKELVLCFSGFHSISLLQCSFK